jgi:quinate dehydrogenase (quinone)
LSRRSASRTSALVDLPDGHRGTVPAILQTTKRGQLFLFNRATGQPLSEVAEKAVPQAGAAPEEKLSPTQPYSVGMPVIGVERLDERRARGMTLLDQLYCRIDFKTMRYDGDFTQPGLQRALENPGSTGGLNWGSVVIDPREPIRIHVSTAHASPKWGPPPVAFAFTAIASMPTSV